MNAILFALSFVSIGFAALALLIAAQSRHRKSGSGKIDLIGKVGRVEQALSPEGAILVCGEVWRARLATGEIEALRGRRVRVIGAHGHLLLVATLPDKDASS